MRVARLVCTRFLYLFVLVCRNDDRTLDCAVSQLGRAGEKVALVVRAAAANYFTRRLRVRNCRRRLHGAGERRLSPNRTILCIDCQRGTAVDNDVLLRRVQCTHHYARV